MNWLMIIGLIEKLGLPLAEKLWRLWKSGGEPTDADWAELRALGAKTPRSQMLDALASAGIDPNSPKAQALLALVPN